MTRETACKPVGEGDQAGAAITVSHRLGDMLREKGWQPSEAQVCELARLLGDRMSAASSSVR